MKQTKLIILRGPSGSGKSSIAKAIQKEHLTQNKLISYIEQDYFRRIILKEKDTAHGFNIQLIKETVLFLLQNQYDVIMEGIFDKERYTKMFEEIIHIHPSNNHFFYFDISFTETLRRHATKPNKNDFGEKEMKTWYKNKDLLQCVQEEIISEKSSAEETIRDIRSASKL